MAKSIIVTFRNSTSAQQICTATDNTQHASILNEPLESGEISTQRQLVVGPDDYGHATFGYDGGVPATRDDISDGEQLDIA